MSVGTPIVVMHLGPEHQDPTIPPDMRTRFFRLPNEPDPDTLQIISAMVIEPEVSVLPGENYVDVRVTLRTPNAWTEGGAINNSNFIYDALRKSVQAQS